MKFKLRSLILLLVLLIISLSLIISFGFLNYDTGKARIATYKDESGQIYSDLIPNNFNVF